MKKAKILSAILAAALLMAGCENDDGNSMQNSDSDSVTNDSLDLPPYGSMGSAIVDGIEYDIATTTEIVFVKLSDEDLVQIGKLVNLTKLNLMNRKITDISPLSGLNFEFVYQ